MRHYPLCVNLLILPVQFMEPSGFTLSENTPNIPQQALHFYGKGSALFDFKAQIAHERLYQYL